MTADDVAGYRGASPGSGGGGGDGSEYRSHPIKYMGDGKTNASPVRSTARQRRLNGSGGSGRGGSGAGSLSPRARAILSPKRSPGSPRGTIVSSNRGYTRVVPSPSAYPAYTADLQPRRSPPRVKSHTIHAMADGYTDAGP